MLARLPESSAALDPIIAASGATKARLEIYVALLRKWQASQNLVAPATLPAVWTRHVADSAQALAALPEATRWVDLGSGAGFPGLVTAILLADRPGATVHLVESNKGKASFLRTVARETGAPAVVHARRIETFIAGFDAPVEAVSARALASLDDLCRMTAPLVARGAVAVFHKGQDFASELAAATQSWILDLVERPSRVDPGGRIVVVSGIRPR